MLCSKCGKELDENTKVCPECGTTVSNTENVENSKKETINELKDKVSDKTKNLKFNWAEVIGAALFFAWNSYVILHNFCVHDGYFWAILGILINAVIILCAPKMITDLFPKLNPKIGFAVFGAIFLIGAIIGYKPFETYIEESSVEIVNDILVENLGSNVAECTSVTILKETGKNIYKAKAYLDNGNNIDVIIEYYKKTKQIEVTIPY
ncbi:MAG: zinc ribbon domain-containing protein [Spirochaetales bacterium]|nr:zinc ribbon domain-containing protein [Spirochaetales bacterium]